MPIEAGCAEKDFLVPEEGIVVGKGRHGLDKEERLRLLRQGSLLGLFLPSLSKLLGESTALSRDARIFLFQSLQGKVVFLDDLDEDLHRHHRVIVRAMIGELGQAEFLDERVQSPIVFRLIDLLVQLL